MQIVIENYIIKKECGCSIVVNTSDLHSEIVSSILIIRSNVGRDGSPSGLISLTPPVRLWYPQLINFNMGEEAVKDKKIMMAITAPNIRGIVKVSRELSIQREDIVTLTKEGSEFILVYYGRQ